MKRLLMLLFLAAAFSLWFGNALAATDEEIAQAIDSGMAWLAGQQNLDGSWYDFEKIGYTGLAVKKFEHHAVDAGWLPLDPAYEYYDQVKRGLDYLFLHATTIPITVQPHGDPDSDGDGIGIMFDDDSSYHRTYEAGIALMAIAESYAADSIVDVPGSDVDGWSYYDVAVDIVDYLVFGQIDSGDMRGGWGYEHNALWWGDNSNTGYATLGLAYAQAPPPYGFSIPMPQFMLDELSDWIDYIQCATPGSDFGGSGYGTPCDWVNILKTGNLLFELALLGETDGPRVEDALDYIANHWSDNNQDPGWHHHYQAMFCVMKGMEFQGIDVFNGIDWYPEFADSIVASQNADGSWGPDYWDFTNILATAWALLTLELAAPPPVVTYVDLDIKPTSCPNPLNVKPYNREERSHDNFAAGDPGSAAQEEVVIRGRPRAVLPVAILGTDEFDVTQIDPASLLLLGVPPLRWHYEDVATPVDDTTECACTTKGADGYMDLTLKFDRADVVDALGAVNNGDVIPITITGLLSDSTEIEGTDCVIIRGDRGTTDDSDGGLFTMGDNYPNPFNPVTEISYELATPSHVTLEIYNVLGQRVTTLYDGFAEAGAYLIQWDATDLSGHEVSSGVYFYRMTVGDVIQTKKMLLLK